MAQRSARRTVIRSATEMPPELIDEVIEAMAERMTGSVEARTCAGLSFTFAVSDLDLLPARYAIARGGRVRLTRDDPSEASFTFTGPADVFDSVLLGRQNALAALLRRRIHLQGSLSHFRQLMRMMPSVHRAYAESRQDLMDRHAEVYDFRF